uniref:hypothetical protein n=1 Tax=Nonlabens sp. Ci31 TaxID=2608253 RepID=UPI0014759988|nr:hypothetical protein [Nonlabens sp. Ci31]
MQRYLFNSCAVFLSLLIIYQWFLLNGTTSIKVDKMVFILAICDLTAGFSGE